jgi:transcriptional regulator with XRE-family HTH domain
VYKFGERLAEWRKAAGLSQSELAGRAGVRQQAISQLESGQYLPRQELVETLADALGVELREVIDALGDDGRESVRTRPSLHERVAALEQKIADLERALADRR